MMKHLHIRLFLLCAILGCCFLLSSCEKNDGPVYITIENTNGNNRPGNGDNDGNSNITNEVTNIEIPKLDSETGDVYAHYVTYKGQKVLNFVVDWHKDKLHSRWVAFTFTSTTSGQSWNRNNWENTEWGGDPFQPDPLIPTDERTDQYSYKGSGYNRGHLLASADRLFSKEGNEQTFYMSNMSPQQGSFNSNDWSDLENQVRNWGRNSSFRDTLFVVKGGTIRDDQIIKYIDNASYDAVEGQKIAVPKYYFMALLCKKHNGKQNTYKAIGFWVEHKSYGGRPVLSNWAVSIDELEAKTGIDFFCNLPDGLENSVERIFNISEWTGLK